MCKVYGDIFSGNCYKVKLLLSLLGKEHEWLHVDIMSGDQKSKRFLKRNPVGKIPLLETVDGYYLSESNAILLHLSEGTHLLPEEKWQRAKVYQWLFFEQYSHEPNVAVARYIIRYLNQAEEQKQRLAKKHEAGYSAIAIMEDQLSKTRFLAGDQYTVADIALYAYTHVADEGHFDLKPYKKVRKWLKKVSSQDNHISMQQAADEMQSSS